MKSLYDVLGASANDDAQAIKRAFRNAVKMNHPDLHPNDPDAALRFRRIVTANAILRDEKQRAAYDQLLAHERQRLDAKAAHQQLQLRQQRRSSRLKMGGAAIVVVGLIAGGLVATYRVFLPALQAASVEAKGGSSGVQPARKDKVVLSAASAIVSGRRNEALPAAVPAEAARDSTDDVSQSADGPKEDADGLPAQDGAQALADNYADASGDPPKLDAKPDSKPDAKTDAKPDVKAEAKSPEPKFPEPKPEAAPRELKLPAAAEKPHVAALAGRETPSASPSDASFYRELGSVSYRIGDFPHAVVNLDQAIRRDPRDARSFHLRGNAWDEMGAFSKAVSDYNEAIRLDPKNPLYFHDRAIMWHRRGELDRALSDLDQAARLGAADPSIYCDRGLIWYEKGNRAKAISDFAQAAKQDPHFAAYIIRGLIRHRASEFNVAFADLGRMIRVSPAVIDAAKKAK